MPWDHYPCTVKGKVESTALGEALSLSDFHSRELLRSKLYSMNKEHYWGWAELPFRRVRPRWWFMWGKNEKETKMIWGRWLWTHHNAFIFIRVVRWLYGCFSFCGTFWSYLLTCYLVFLSEFTLPEIKKIPFSHHCKTWWSIGWTLHKFMSDG